MRNRRLGLVEGEPAERRLRGEEIHLDGAFDVAERGSGCVVIRERGELGCPVGSHLRRVRAPARHEGGARRSREGGQAPDDRPSDELVGEPVREPGSRTLDEQPGVDGLVDRIQEGRLLQHVGVADGRELEVGAGDRGELEQLEAATESRCSRWSATSRTVAGVPSSDVGRTSRAADGPIADGSLVDQLAPELGDQEGVAAGEVADDAVSSFRRLGPVGQADELRELGVCEAAEPDPDHAFRPVHVHKRLGELGSHVRLGVPERRHDQHARRGARPDEVADEEKRRRVGPVEVLEHEQHGRLVRDGDQQLRHGRVESQPLGVRVRRGPGAWRGPVGEVGDEPRKVGLRGAEPVEDGRPHSAPTGELHERRGERRVR